MVDRLENAIDKKNRIKDFIKIRGPTLPVYVSKEIGVSTLFASAFLSELASEGVLRISDLKVGGSPLYYLPGQEPLLANFSQYLNSKEKEAFGIVRERGLLRDDDLEPAIRVALRQIRDFAFPIRANLDGKEIMFWRWLENSEENAKAKITELLVGKEEAKEKVEEKKAEKIEDKREEKKSEVSEEKVVEKTQEAEIEKKREKKLKEKTETKKEEVFAGKIEKSEKKKIGKKEQERFGIIDEIVKYFKENNIEMIEEVDVRKKLYIAKVKIDSSLGKMGFLAIVKDKKKIGEDDLAAAIQKANSEKLPALFLTKGKLDKEGLAYLEKWGNMIRVRNY